MPRQGRVDAVRRLPAGNPAALTVFDIFYAAAGAAAALVGVPCGYARSSGHREERERVRGRLALASALAFPPAGDLRRVQFHGVSFGEVRLLPPLFRALREARCALEPFVTSTTATGLAEAKRLFPQLRVAPFPVDFPGCAARYFEATRPSGVVLLEWEIWPAFLRHAARRRIPVAVVNGRFSQKTERRYRMLPEYVRRRLAGISSFAMQNADYAERLASFGIPEERIVVTGNIKFDALPDPSKARNPQVEACLGRDASQAVFVAGSTHAPEEEIVARAWRRAGGQGGRLVVVPRHVERSDEVERILSSVLGGCARWSQWKASGSVAPTGRPVLVDTMGDLEDFYRVATAAFVGGSLLNERGGQNVLEPAALGVPVVHGPSVPNFTEEARILAEAGASRVAVDEEGLATAMRDLLADRALAARMGAAGIAAVAPHRGAAARTVDALRRARLVEWEHS
jgi:3-deoxy-D-manno-octulosonic-acid transferase